MDGDYYAIARRQAQWVYVCAGADPVQVYHDAIEILQGRAASHGELPVAVSPLTELLLDSLRVVPAVVARERYQVRFLSRVREDDDV